MDKNKSRSDLLKAGRKKLQQFREKKDGKGGSSSGHGKSSKKSDKSEHHQSDTDATSSAAKSTVSSIPKVEVESNVDSNLRVADSHSMEYSLASETDVAAVDPSSVVIMLEGGSVDASLVCDAELSPLQSRVGDADSALLDYKERTQIVDAEEPRATPATLDALVLEGETKHADNSGITDLTASSASVDIAEEVAEMEAENRKEMEQLLPLQTVVPDVSLIQARGDQVTDEGDNLGLKKFDRCSEPELDGDAKLVLSDLDGSAATLHETDATPATSHQVENQLKDAVVGLPDEEKSGTPFANDGNDQKEGAQADAENKTVTELESKILALKESLGQAEEALTVAHSELQEKASELEQSDQRVSSIREKLSIAVGKGKALVVQRDSLKQSLVETSKELERCSQELQLKGARHHELETKLKTYMEAGERVEALESELSYIRNSATALRESFLLKDSVLQRIEEILEELDLPEHFHSRGTIEKIEWLARSATGNSLPVTDWDQKSVGASYSDAWKEDAPPSSSSGDDLRIKYEELQNKFYGLAEQTEMLEQSLMERNHVVQRWEELLDRINMPSHLRSVEVEGRIEWLGTALMEADHDRNSLLQKIDKLENYCGLVTADLEDSQKRISELEADLQAVIHEREHFSERLEDSQKRISELEADLQAVIHEREHLPERLEDSQKRISELEADLQAVIHERKHLSERLEDSQKRISELEADLQAVIHEREHLSERLEDSQKRISELEANLQAVIHERDHLSERLEDSQKRIFELEADLQAVIHEREHIPERLEDLPKRISDLEADLQAVIYEREHLYERLEDSQKRISELKADLQAVIHEREHLSERLEDSQKRISELEADLQAVIHEREHLFERLEDSQKRISELEADLQAVIHEREHLSERLEHSQKRIAELGADLQAVIHEREHLPERLEDSQKRISELEANLQVVIHKREHLFERLEDSQKRISELEADLQAVIHEREHLSERLEDSQKRISELDADLQAVIHEREHLSERLEDSQKRISELDADLQAVIHEREYLFERLENLTGDHERILAKAVQFEHENGKLQSEVSNLQEKLAEKVGNEERIQSIEVELHKLEGLVSDALQEPDAKDLVSGECGTECLEALLRKLIEHYSALSMVKPVLGSAVDGIQSTEADANLDESGSRDMIITEKPDVAVMKKDLEAALDNLMHVKEERDVYLEKQQSLICEVEALDRKREELQEQLIQEGQKSASIREKLIVAVRKGKSLVQQRDSLKQTLEEMNNEVDRLKSEISHRENILADNEQKIKDLSAYPEMVEALESEKLFLRNRLTETEHLLQEREHILSSTINALGDIDVSGEVAIDDPVGKLKQIGKLLHDLHASLASSEQESRKSRRAAELLLAELNEVQERNDYLQEELAKAGDELADISNGRDVAEAAKFEALSRLEKLSTVYSEGKQKQYYELMILKTSVNELKKGISDVNSLLADVFSKDLEFMHNLEANMESCLKQRDTTDVGLPILSACSGITSRNSENKNLLSIDSWSGLEVPDHLDDSAIVEVCRFVGTSLQELKTDIGALIEKLYKHPISLHETASNLSKMMDILRGEMTSQKKSLEALGRDFTLVESVGKEKDMEIGALRKNIALLYEACANSIMEIANKKAELLGNNSVLGEWGMSLNRVTSVDGELPSSGQAYFNSEEHVKAIADRLSLTLKDFTITKTENVESNLKEMKTTIADLQRELQEKEIQKDRICSELVNQIKGAEAAAQSYLQELQSEKARVYDMEQQLKVMEEERSLLELRLKELQNEQMTLTELQDKVKSLLDVLLAKDQEIEALMQALDEEEIQMDELKKKIEELEKALQQKNLNLENLEASRGKLAKRLSITVNKFDELHNLSESLLAEVEKLQSQLQDRDAEISFLRQEVTRCTNEVLVASQMNKKRDSDEIQEILSLVDTMISRTGVHDLHLEDKGNSQVQCKELLQKKISAIISEFEDLRVAAQSRDAMLQVERSKVQELTHREEVLQKSLRDKESQLNMLDDVGDSGQENSLTSEILEVEPVINKWTVPGPSISSQVRSLRKVNNDQVAIAIDTEPDSSRLEDEDDDKVHGFKSLTTSRVVPRFTRPVSDMIDGLWVSCDRALQRQPALRLSIIVYWAVLHTLLASFVF